MSCLPRRARSARPTPVRLALEPLAGRLAPAVLPLTGAIAAPDAGGTDPAVLASFAADLPIPTPGTADSSSPETDAPVLIGLATDLLPVTDPPDDPALETAGDGPMDGVWSEPQPTGGPVTEVSEGERPDMPAFLGGIYVG